MHLHTSFAKVWILTASAGQALATHDTAGAVTSAVFAQKQASSPGLQPTLAAAVSMQVLCGKKSKLANCQNEIEY